MIRGVILSSGQARRMGTQKLLLSLNGSTVVEQVIKNARDSSIDEIFLVYGEPRSAFESICSKNCIKGVYNRDYALGQSQSIIKGIEDSNGMDGFLFMLGDQPFVTAAIIDTVILEHKRYPQDIIVPVYEGKRGNPTIFPNRYKSVLMNLSGDTGGRQVLKDNEDSIREVNIDYQYAFFDIDTISDYQIAREIMRSKR